MKSFGAKPPATKASDQQQDKKSEPDKTNGIKKLPIVLGAPKSTTDKPAQKQPASPIQLPSIKSTATPQTLGQSTKPKTAPVGIQLPQPTAAPSP